MGAYGSGRQRTHDCTYECVRVDMRHFKQHLRSPGKVHGHITTEQLPEELYHKGKAVIGFTLRCYEDASETDKHGQCWPVYGLLTLKYYRAIGKGEGEYQHHRIPLVTTPCNYGGRRWWAICPNCNARVRVLFITPRRQMLPACQVCCDVHYASQMATDKERQITREKHLLRNYGYFWAAHEYHSMKTHYFEVTPEYEQLARRSQLERELYIVDHLISTQKLLVNLKLRELKYALKTRQISNSDKATLYQYAKDVEVVQLLKNNTEIERAIIESNLDRPLPALPDIETLAAIDKTIPGKVVSDEELLAAAAAGLTGDIQEMMAQRDQLRTELEELGKAA
jgi:hypothetical protein